MNDWTNTLSSRMSLRVPQRESLEILDRLSELLTLKKDVDLKSALEAIQTEYPLFADFERDFPCFCFALATGVGKTRLMGAFIAFLHLTKGIRNFFILAPNLTVYNKLVTDFTPGTQKYVFAGIDTFLSNPPTIITGDNYESMVGTLFDDPEQVEINIFNVSKITAKDKGHLAGDDQKASLPRFRRLSEYIGKSYFDYLAAKDDLVLLMDESHHYRASAGVRAINELHPVLGLELTATPLVESGTRQIPFKNIIYQYSLGNAMRDGFVKEPTVVTRKDFSPNGIGESELQRIKLEDGVRLHETTKVELFNYAREKGQKIVKPFVLIIAKDTDHAAELLDIIRSDNFFEGRYRDKVIQVDSSTKVKEEWVVEKLLQVEKYEEPTEIVIHVNMLKEGWDVNNLYTIIPLRAANARTLIEQSIGRGLRLPYGRLTGRPAVDRLSIVAHDRFREIVEEANQPDSPIRMKEFFIDNDGNYVRPESIVIKPKLDQQLGINHEEDMSDVVPDEKNVPSLSTHSPEERGTINAVMDVVETMRQNPDILPSVASLKEKRVVAEIERSVKEQLASAWLPGIADVVPVCEIVKETLDSVVRETIDIPRILVLPEEGQQAGFEPFTLDLRGVKYAPISEELWRQSLITNAAENIKVNQSGYRDNPVEAFIEALMTDFDDIVYEGMEQLLTDLANQTIRFYESYMTPESASKVIRCHASAIAAVVHEQMHQHLKESEIQWCTEVKEGFTPLKTGIAITFGQTVDYRKPPQGNISKFVFTGFDRCLYSEQRFDSEPERLFAIILEHDSQRWFKPLPGQFLIDYRFYKNGTDCHEYVPDFVAETNEANLMIEVKAANKLDDKEVLAKKEAALKWCHLATEYAEKHDGKPWKYVLIPHDAIASNMSLDGLVNRFEEK